MTIEMLRKYRSILKAKCIEGLNLLETLSIKDEKFQTVVDNVNNCDRFHHLIGRAIEEQKEKRSKKETPSEE